MHKTCSIARRLKSTLLNRRCGDDRLLQNLSAEHSTNAGLAVAILSLALRRLQAAFMVTDPALKSLIRAAAPSRLIVRVRL